MQVSSRSFIIKMVLRYVIPHADGTLRAYFYTDHDSNASEQMKFSIGKTNGEASFVINNPDTAKKLIMGASYYFDINPIMDEGFFNKASNPNALVDMPSVPSLTP